METRIQVTGMTCMHCVAAVTKALQRVPGVETADVSLDNKQALVTGSADTADLLAAIQNEGYEAELL
jgi:copper chaperone CopZ